MPNIAYEKNTADGIFQLAVFSKNDNWQLSKNSNMFDEMETNSVGLYGIKNMKNQKEAMESINQYYQAIVKMDEVLRAQGKSFSDLSQPHKHSTYIKIGKFQLDQNHPYYAKIDDALKKILNKIDTEKNDVAELSFGDQGPKVSFIKNNKIVKNESYSMNFNCKQQGPKKLCTIKNYGDLFIE